MENVADRYVWLRKWLIECDDDEPIQLSDGHTYQLLSYFQIAFYLYTIYHDRTANNYLWYVSENYILYDHQLISSKRYATEEDAIWAAAHVWPAVRPRV